MKISVYVPKDLEAPLQAEAEEVEKSPSMFLQDLLRERLRGSRKKFSDSFLALAGSWEDSRSAEAIAREIESRRDSVQRPSLL